MKLLDLLFRSIGISFCLMFIGTCVLGYADSVVLFVAWICGGIIGLLTEIRKDSADKKQYEIGYKNGYEDLYHKLQNSFYYTAYNEDIMTREDLDEVVEEMRSNNGN